MPVIQFILQRDQYFKPGNNVVNLLDLRTDEDPTSFLTQKLSSDLGFVDELTQSFAEGLRKKLSTLDLSSLKGNKKAHIELKLGQKTIIGIIASKTNWHLFDDLMAPPRNDKNVSEIMKDPISMIGIEFHFDGLGGENEIRSLLFQDGKSTSLTSVKDLNDAISRIDISSMIDLDSPQLLSSLDLKKDKTLQAQNGGEKDASQTATQPDSDSKASITFDPASQKVDDFLDGFEIIEDAKTREGMVDKILAGLTQTFDPHKKEQILRDAYVNEKISTHRVDDHIKAPLNAFLKPIRNAFIFWKDEDAKNRAPIETHSQKRVAEELEHVKETKDAVSFLLD
jgi:hypothetical protein